MVGILYLARFDASFLTLRAKQVTHTHTCRHHTQTQTDNLPTYALASITWLVSLCVCVCVCVCVHTGHGQGSPAHADPHKHTDTGRADSALSQAEWQQCQQQKHVTRVRFPGDDPV